MPTTARYLEVVKVFLASPGDVAECRKRVRRAAERVNRLVANPNGLHFRVIGWEDLPANTARRVQELINPAVMEADVFIGILNKRFGTPTGKAESGTIEEYRIAKQRFDNENPPPNVKLYFKKLTPKDLSNPSRQLRKVLRFRDEVAGSSLYQEFSNAESLGTRVENELADLVYSKWRRLGTEAQPRLKPMSSLGDHLVTQLINSSQGEISHLIEELNATQNDFDYAVDALVESGLIRRAPNSLRLSNSTHTFLAVARQLFDSNKGHALLESNYYRSIAPIRLVEVIRSRYHCDVSKSIEKVLVQLSAASPGVAEYLLFGDTELYDNLVQHAADIQKETYAQEVMTNHLLQNVLIRYGSDRTQGLVLDTLLDKAINGEVLRIKLSAATFDRPVFSVESAVPTIRVQVEGEIQKGQMVTGSPELLVNIGTLLAHMEEYGLSIRRFDEVLEDAHADDSTRVAALNNKGLVMEQTGNVELAIDLWQTALKIDPSSPEPQANLSRVKTRLASVGQSPLA